MTRILTLILATMISGIAAGLVGSLALNALVRLLGVTGDFASGLLVFGTFLTIYGLAAAVVLGLPAHVVLSRMARARWTAYMLTGIVAGVLVGLLFSGMREDAWIILLTSVAAGGAGGFAFWLIARPDRRLKL